MKSGYRLIGTFCVMAVLAVMFSSCASQKLGCPMKITKVQHEKDKNC
ncbi:hypothetical protein AAHN97_16515 [Chitinophaga niabensis]